ncbi:hypothetical protein JYK22_02200, partial [Nonomuraea sp. RK-328]|nr:hypothetical protein [Nonomuraea sp. RK-328]
VYLKSFSIRGFRSLMDVSSIPVSKPTILAGHNDGGKSAVLAALAFLLRDYTLEEDDRTYLLPPDGHAPVAELSRCGTTEVEGLFELDDWEQQAFSLPAEVRIRRCADEDQPARLECWTPVPHDERLRNLSGYKLAQLKELAKELGVSASSQRKADIEESLRSYARENSGPAGWVEAPAQMENRLPQLLAFGGKLSQVNESVKSALMGRYRDYENDENLVGQIKVIEDEIKERIRRDAKMLCDHIRSRCPDLTDVFVEPDISFSQGFRGASLRIARASGEHVSLERSGLGSARRISLAIWEWTSDFLSADNAVAPEACQAEPAEPEPTRVQTIIAYDEPDTHLDYDHQRKIMQLIREQAAVPHVSVIVATHSMNLIDGVDISDVVNLKLQGRRTTMERLGADDHDSVDRHLQQLAMALGLRNSVLLNERCFLAVEGASEQRAIPLLFRLSQGMTLQSAGIALWCCDNNEGALHLARYLYKHGRSVMLMIDADSRSGSKSLFRHDRLVQTFGGDVHRLVTFLGEEDGMNEFEELFGDDVWATVANTVWPKETPWLDTDFGALRGSGKFSKLVHELVQTQSLHGPSGKPEMMYQLASALKDPGQVPVQLQEAFAELRQLAG